MQAQNNTTLALVTHDDALADKCQTHYRIEQGKIIDARTKQQTVTEKTEAIIT